LSYTISIHYGVSFQRLIGILAKLLTGEFGDGMIYSNNDLPDPLWLEIAVIVRLRRSPAKVVYLNVTDGHHITNVQNVELDKDCKDFSFSKDAILCSFEVTSFQLNRKATEGRDSYYMLITGVDEMIPLTETKNRKFYRNYGDKYIVDYQVSPKLITISHVDFRVQKFLTPEDAHVQEQMLKSAQKEHLHSIGSEDNSGSGCACSYLKCVLVSVVHNKMFTWMWLTSFTDKDKSEFMGIMENQEPNPLLQVCGELTHLIVDSIFRLGQAQLIPWKS